MSFVPATLRGGREEETNLLTTTTGIRGEKEKAASRGLLASGGMSKEKPAGGYQSHNHKYGHSKLGMCAPTLPSAYAGEQRKHSGQLKQKQHQPAGDRGTGGGGGETTDPGRWLQPQDRSQAGLPGPASGFQEVEDDEDDECSLMYSTAAACTVQRALREYHRRQWAATVIQSQALRCLARRRVNRRRQEAARRIQRAYRAHHLSRCLAAEKIEALARWFLSHRRRSVARKAAVAVQVQWRRYVARRDYLELLRNRAAVRMDTSLELMSRRGNVRIVDALPTTAQYGLVGAMRVARYIAAHGLDWLADLILLELARHRPARPLLFIYGLIAQRDSDGPRGPPGVPSDEELCGAHEYLECRHPEVKQILSCILHYGPRLLWPDPVALLRTMCVVQEYLDATSRMASRRRRGGHSRRDVCQVDGGEELLAVLDQHAAAAATYLNALLGGCRFCHCRAGLVAAHHCEGLYVCGADSCVEKRLERCSRILACGHSCEGMYAETDCPPCVDPSCASARHGATGADLCVLCTGPLIDHACVRLAACGHVLHGQCVVEVLAAVLEGPLTKAGLGFCTCPVCHTPLEQQEQLASLTVPFMSLGATLAGRVVDAVKAAAEAGRPAMVALHQEGGGKELLQFLLWRMDGPKAERRRSGASPGLSLAPPPPCMERAGEFLLEGGALVVCDGDSGDEGQDGNHGATGDTPQVTAWAKGVGYGTCSTDYSSVWNAKDAREAGTAEWTAVQRALELLHAYLECLLPVGAVEAEVAASVLEALQESSLVRVLENALGLSTEERLSQVALMRSVLTVVCFLSDRAASGFGGLLAASHVCDLLAAAVSSNDVQLKAAAMGAPGGADEALELAAVFAECVSHLVAAGFGTTGRSRPRSLSPAAATAATAAAEGASRAAAAAAAAGVPPGGEAGAYEALRGRLLTFFDFSSDGSPHTTYDHYYSAAALKDKAKVGGGNNGRRLKRLSREIGDLAHGLPFHCESSIFVAVDENRPDMIRALVTAPDGTPYEGGCFQFDVYCPPEYPEVPPCVNMCTNDGGQMRFNPNLYADGYVCLSLLGTWDGEAGETWDPNASTLLQVLVSVQALIFVPEPFFNEPGYEDTMGTEEGNQDSLEYNKEIRMATVLFAMIGQLENPVQGFEDVIRAHFFIKKHRILQTVKKWAEEDPVVLPSVQKLERLLGALQCPHDLAPVPEGPPTALLANDSDDEGGEGCGCVHPEPGTFSVGPTGGVEPHDIQVA